MNGIASLYRTLAPLGAAENEPLSRHTSFHIGGPAAVFLRPKDEDALALALKAASDADVPLRILGNGTNLLVSDRGFPGLIVCLDAPLSKPIFDGLCVHAPAGLSTAALARGSVSHGLQNMECLCGIPGSVGGAIAMNAGCYGQEIRDVLTDVRLMRPDGNSEWIKVKKSDLGKRTSLYRWPRGVVLEAVFALEPDDGYAAERMADCNRMRQRKQPLTLPSAGSVFKRPEGFFAGQLIEESGCKGLSVGDAQVSALHAGFIVNRGHADCAQVTELIALVQRRVFERFGVSLEPELQFLGPPDEAGFQNIRRTERAAEQGAITPSPIQADTGDESAARPDAVSPLPAGEKGGQAL